MNENLELPSMKEVVNLRIEVLFRKKSSMDLINKNIITPVQGDSVDIYLRTKNLSDKIFQGAKLKDLAIDSKAYNIGTDINKDIQIRALNPEESYEQKVDWTTFKFDGAYWISLNLIPSSPSQEVMTFQYDSAHEKEERYDINTWGSTIYLEGRLATLQTKTNNYILLLTSITVWEAIFGIKKSLVGGLSCLSTVFSLLAKGLSFIVSII